MKRFRLFATAAAIAAVSVTPVAAQGKSGAAPREVSGRLLQHRPTMVSRKRSPEILRRAPLPARQQRCREECGREGVEPGRRKETGDDNGRHDDGTTSGTTSGSTTTGRRPPPEPLRPQRRRRTPCR